MIDGKGNMKAHLGTLLVKAGVIDSDQLAAALAIVEKDDRWLGEVLIDRGYATETQIQEFLSVQLGYPVVKLDSTYIDREVATAISEKFSRRHGVLPLYRADTDESHVIVVAMTDPANIVVQDELKNAFGSTIFPALAAPSEMARHLNALWSAKRPQASAADDAVPVLPSSGDLKPNVAKILEMLFRTALETRATSIHFGPKKKYVSVQLRIDGDYHQVTYLPSDAYGAVLSRLKILAKIGVGESSGHVEEGWFHIRPDISQPQIEVRTTIIPAVFGTKAVLKITRRSDILRPLDRLGMEPAQGKDLETILASERGLLLISGKNDSGKTTLAYSSLARLGSASRLVVTIEDPYSYPVSNFNQIAKTDLAGKERLSLAEAVRAVERQEPHIVYLASPDSEAEMQVLLRMASTGRFVLTSLYADDATSSYWVCFQHGLDPHAVASVLSGVVFCRLARLICPGCRAKVDPDPGALAALGLLRGEIAGAEFFEGKGCKECGGLGYKGRTGVYEVLRLHDHLRDMVASKAPSEPFRRAAIDSGMMTLASAALEKAKRGLISLQEVLRVAS